MRKSNIIQLFFTIILFSFLFSCNKELFQKKQPVAKKGTIDLTNWDFKKNGVVELKGEWKFKWLIDEKELSQKEYNDNDWEIYNVPTSWNKAIGKINGYCWLRLKVILPDNNKENLGLYQLKTETAYKMFINGREFLNNGNPGNNRNETIPEQLPQVKLLNEGKEVIIAWKISNYHFLKGGPTISPKIGILDDLNNEVFGRYILDAIVLGIFLMMVIYNLLLWYTRKEDIIHLLFSIFNILMFFRLLAVNYFLEKLFTNIMIYPIKMKIELITMSFGCVVFAEFIYRLFSQDINKKILRVMQIIGILISVIVLITPVWISTHLLTYLQIFLGIVSIWLLVSIIIAVKNKSVMAKVVLFGFVLFFIIIINDVLYSQYLLNTGFISQIGFVMFIFCYSYILSVRSTKAFITSEKLLKELQAEVNKKVEIIKEQEEKITKALIDFNNQIIEINEEKTQFFIKLAHEIKTPLTLIEGYLDRDIKKRGISDDIMLVKKNVLKLKRDVINYLDEEKLERGQIFYDHNKITDLSEILNEMMISFKEIANKRRIKIEKNIKPNLCMKIDPYAIERIISNLLDNAIKYNKYNGRIDIILKGNKKKLDLIIEDTGIGMSKEEQVNIFEPYQQVKQNRRSIEGMGMGLNIVKKIVGEVNGEIKVDSKQGAGTKFIINFERYFLKGKEKIYKQIRFKESIGNIDELKLKDIVYYKDRSNILVVEDNIDMLSFLQQTLSEKYNFFYARDGGEALDTLVKMPSPDLIISDIIMEGMNGYEFYENIYKDKYLKSIPFIFLTAKNSENEKLKGLKKGAIDYITKPFDIDEFLAKIDSLIKAEISLKDNVKENMMKRVQEFFDKKLNRKNEEN